jgi:hypothetical protein
MTVLNKYKFLEAVDRGPIGLHAMGVPLQIANVYLKPL